MTGRSQNSFLLKAANAVLASIDVVEVGFLSDYWRDVISIVGLVGVFVTIVALVAALWQIYKTTSASQAATAAAVASLNESKERYDRHIVSQVNKFYSEAKLFIDKEEWKLAAQRLDDVADLIVQFGKADMDWNSLAAELREFSYRFRRVGGAEIKFKSIRWKWHKLESSLSDKIAHHHGPFQPIQESKDADGR